MDAEHRAGDLRQHPLQLVAATTHDHREGVRARQVGGQRPELARDGRADGLERHAVSPEPLRGTPVQVPAGRPPRRPDPHDVGDQPVQPVPTAGLAEGLDEEVRRCELGEHRRSVLTAGERVGEVGAHQIDDADLLEEREELGRLPIQHLGDEIARHAVVVPGEGGHGGRDVVQALQVQGDQAKPRRPPFGAVDQPLDPAAVHRRPSAARRAPPPRQPEGEIRRTHLVTSPAKRSRGSGHGGSRRVVTSSDNPGGGRSTSRSNPAWTSGERSRADCPARAPPAAAHGGVRPRPSRGGPPWVPHPPRSDAALPQAFPRRGSARQRRRARTPVVRRRSGRGSARPLLGPRHRPRSRTRPAGSCPTPRWRRPA